jgi:hypothetical protein
MREPGLDRLAIRFRRIFPFEVLLSSAEEPGLGSSRSFRYVVT